jgi:hypothetical protein
MAILLDDDFFYFNEAKFKWIEEGFLQVLVNADWNILTK